MRSAQSCAIATLIALTCVATATGATLPGMVGDGKPSMYYVTSTGEFGIQPDGYTSGLFLMRSAAGIFTGDAIFPPGTLFDVNTVTEKGWAVLPPHALRKDFSLGIIAASGLTAEFLFNDLTLFGPDAGLEARVRYDFVILCCTPLIPRDANLGDRTRGAQIEHLFTALENRRLPGTISL
jgi:hypothetical protein